MEFGQDPEAAAAVTAPRPRDDAAGHRQADAERRRPRRCRPRRRRGRRQRALRRQHAAGDGHRPRAPQAAHRTHLRRPVRPGAQAVALRRSTRLPALSTCRSSAAAASPPPRRPRVHPRRRLGRAGRHRDLRDPLAPIEVLEASRPTARAGHRRHPRARRRRPPRHVLVHPIRPQRPTPSPPKVRRPRLWLDCQYAPSNQQGLIRDLGV